MTRVFFFIWMAALAACATPKQRCVDQANHALETVQTLIAQTETTLARGYAITHRPDVIVYTDQCLPDDGTVANSFCDRLHPVTTRTPVAVDLSRERAKLQGLKRKEAALAHNAAAATRSCEGKRRF